MENALKIFVFILFLNIVNSAYAIESHDQIDKYFKKNLFKEFSQEINGATLKVDPRVEYIQTIMLLLGDASINPTVTDYNLAILDEFEKHKSHPSLPAMLKLFIRLFHGVDEPIFFAVKLTNDFKLRKDIDNTELRRNQDVDSLLYHFRVFAKDTDYIRFFNSNASFYKISINTTAYNLSDFDGKRRILEYYRISEKEKIHFNIILNFMGNGNFGPGLQTKNGRELSAIISPSNSVGRVPAFSVKDIYNLVWHEFSHPFVNHFIDKYYSEFENRSDLFVPIKESMSAQAYPEWRIAIKEHLVRAVVCRLAADKYGEEFSNLNFERLEKGKRYIYIDLMIDALREYEEQPDRNFESVVLDIAHRLRKVTTTDIEKWMDLTDRIREPEVETLPKIGEAYKDLLIIVPSNEQDKSKQKNLIAFLEQFKTRHYPDAKIVYDTTALQINLSKHDLMVFGTTKGNLFLNKVITELPITVTTGGVIADRYYEGKDVVFISSWLHPKSSERNMDLYIALSPENLINIDRVPRGGTHYHITRGVTTLKSGNYVNYMKIWQF
jgi:hypothetical protein